MQLEQTVLPNTEQPLISVSQLCETQGFTQVIKPSYEGPCGFYKTERQPTPCEASEQQAYRLGLPVSALQGRGPGLWWVRELRQARPVLLLVPQPRQEGQQCSVCAITYHPFQIESYPPI